MMIREDSPMIGEDPMMLREGPIMVVQENQPIMVVKEDYPMMVQEDQEERIKQGPPLPSLAVMKAGQGGITS